MAAIERLRELQPHDPQISRWSEQIHNYVLKTANKKLRNRNYRESANTLRAIPPKMQCDKSRRLLRHVEELEHLDSVLQLAPVVNTITIEAATRLTRIDESNETARTTLEEMTKRYRAAPRIWR